MLCLVDRLEIGLLAIYEPAPNQVKRKQSLRMRDPPADYFSAFVARVDDDGSPLSTSSTRNSGNAHHDTEAHRDEELLRHI